MSRSECEHKTDERRKDCILFNRKCRGDARKGTRKSSSLMRESQNTVTLDGKLKSMIGSINFGRKKNL